MTLVVAVVLQICIAVSSEGLTRSLAELTAFLIAIALMLVLKNNKLNQTRSQQN
ncbi:hypothetical protein ATG66_3002 [Vibrio sp. ES.051]|uniref:hypothetical protein n=1 Tax=Vibrio sp. ES.051 TaxID=1761909 RepID=UPI000C00D6BC|nr:hypothetical protein [Vibrio sp. ES.051]PFG45912.1 hypothetical protein ATG66_3002 [Vibrio sp. ES.051]